MLLLHYFLCSSFFCCCWLDNKSKMGGFVEYEKSGEKQNEGNKSQATIKTRQTTETHIN